jgi:hypothetical protein
MERKLDCKMAGSDPMGGGALYFEKNIDFSCSFLGYCLKVHPI